MNVEIHHDVMSSATVKYSITTALKFLISSCRGQHMIFNPDEDSFIGLLNFTALLKVVCINVRRQHREHTAIWIKRQAIIHASVLYGL